MNLDPLAILNALPEATLLRAADGVVRHVNPAAERLLDVRAADVVGGRDLPGISDEQLASSEARFEIYGLERPTMIEIVPVAGGGSLVIYRDWSAQKSMERYLSMMRFDLSSVLTHIRGWADIAFLSQASVTPQQHDEMLMRVSQSAVRAKLDLMFLHDCMWYENLNVRVFPGPFDLTEIMQETLKPLQQAYDFTEVQIDSDREPPPVRCDRGRMRFVLRALFRHVISLQDRQLHITFSLEDQYLTLNCSINHTRPSYRHAFAHLDLCRTLLEQQSGTFEFTVSSETTQHCIIRLPTASEPPAA